MVNQSKKNNPRFWKKWEDSGAIGTVESLPFYSGLVREDLLEVKVDDKMVFMYESSAIRRGMETTGRKCNQLRIGGSGVYYLGSQVFEGDQPNRLSFNFADGQEVKMKNGFLSRPIEEVFTEHNDYSNLLRASKMTRIYSGLTFML